MQLNAKHIEGPLLVTGATGFIGSRLIDRLLAEGLHPRALVLPGDSPPEKWRQRVTVVRGDVCDKRSVHPAVDGCRTVFHLAAVVSDWGPNSQHRRVTVEGTETVLRQAAAQHARVILASSIAAYGDNLSKRPCDEDTPVGAPLGAYSASKQAQERIARRLEAQQSLKVTIIRPANVIGAGSVPWVKMACAQLRAKMPCLVDGGRRTAALTHVDNVVDVFVRAAAMPKTVGRVYNAADGHDITWLRYFTELAQLCGAPPPKPLSRWVAQLAAHTLPHGHYWLRRPGRPAITREALNLVGSSLRIPIVRAERELGYTPLVSYPQAMREIAASLART